MLKDYLRLHFIVLLWGFTAILGKLISVPPVELVFWRTLLAAAGLLGLLAVRRQPWRMPAGEALRLLGVGALVAAHWITFFLAARLSSVSVCLAGMATLALWTSLLEPLLLWRRVRFYEVGLGLLTMVGLYIVTQAVYSHPTPAADCAVPEHGQLLGLGVAVISAGLSALFSVLNSTLVKRHTPMRLTLYEMAGACLSIVLFMPVYSHYFTEGRGLQLALSGYDWLWMFLLAGACTVYAFSSSVELMKRISAFVVNLTINLEPVYGILLAVGMYTLRVPGFGQERLSTGFYIGTLVILLSVLIHPVLDQWNKRRQHKAEAAEAIV
ncbi:DMT family transporter [Hymenobacter psychrotolerans]|uniref:EamA-like transporter family protein n=1 Tax=Hymenobacter psychrotolerans DSM 18569 TaxID=1121959 RepID=A0A1M7CT34_9BACT|nr:DMT family transporter [Hymenobacter psychrotolerans]SHL70375.1 EamA-like transporter family protein [Hymenobacter psychrotolerans DSM 18569]